MELEQFEFTVDAGTAAIGSITLDGVDIDGDSTIDCDRLTGRGGILHAVDRARSLRALVIDAKGLDTTASWPKFQADPANSGNAGVNLLALYRCP